MADFDYYDYYAPSVDMSSMFNDFYASDFGWGGGDWSFPDFDYDFPDFNFDAYNYEIPDFQFDPGAWDFGFDPSFSDFNFADIGDPFALPQGDLNLPTLDLTSAEGGAGFGSSAAPLDMEGIWRQQAANMYAGGDSIMSDANLGQFAMDPFATDVGFPDLNLSASPTLESMTNVGNWGDPALETMGLDMFSTPSSFAPNDVSGVRDYTTPGSFPIANSAVREGKAGPPQSQTDTLKDAQSTFYKMAPLLGLGQLGMGLGGGLLQAFGPQPQQRKPTDLENQRTQAEIDAIRAKIDLERQALEQQMEMARMEAEAAGEDPRLQIAQLQAESAERIAQLNREANEREPLIGTDPRFSTLYDEVTSGTQGLTPDNPQIQAMTQQIYAVRRQAAEQTFTDQRTAIMERANRLGTNPAAELAQIAQKQQEADSALLVEAQQMALAFAQARWEPSTKLLDAILRVVV